MTHFLGDSEEQIWKGITDLCSLWDKDDKMAFLVADLVEARQHIKSLLSHQDKRERL